MENAYVRKSYIFVSLKNTKSCLYYDCKYKCVVGTPVHKHIAKTNVYIFKRLEKIHTQG